jgi:hypothetical protein
MFGTISQIHAQQLQIPNWIRNNAKWWYQGQIQDSEFIKGIQYLVENKIMDIPLTSDGTTKDNKIPSWVKNNAGWWANGTISDNDFVSGIQYLVNSGIILIPYNMTLDNSDEQCKKFTTAAEKETCIEQLEYDKKIKNLLKTATPYVTGPVTFYYVNNELQKTDGEKKLLTIHFIVQNNSNQEVTLTCQRPDSCNYILNDGQNEIPYSTNTLVYGSLTLTPHSPKYLDWTFYSSIDSQKNYTFLIKESWGSGSIPIKIS